MVSTTKLDVTPSGRERVIVNSALWAAAGDALGWTTELARDGTVEARTGLTHVIEPVAWRRLIGGRTGVKVDLPAGTYSDDTQLRLAVCRALRGNGAFDAEAFARVELTAWQGYALGAGRGTKAAAANLAKRGVNWFSNFFETKDLQYHNAGGNGAAMRIQPHVWASPAATQSFLLPVLKDALITHGHPHGFCGAIFHALVLADAVDEGAVPAPFRWNEYIRTFRDLPDLVSQDRQLQAFWLPAWEHTTGHTFESAIASVCDEAYKDVGVVQALCSTGDPSVYTAVLQGLGCLEPKFRGSGLKTSLAASALAWLYREQPLQAALVAAANQLESDTDTIATMAGAVLGAVGTETPAWPIQDRVYIATEASRLASIGRGEKQDSFAYPDLARWQPPATQSDAVGRYKEGLAVVGLGEVEQLGEEYVNSEAVWQWLRLPFGQTVFGKRRRASKNTVKSYLMPSERKQASSTQQVSQNQHVFPSLKVMSKPLETASKEDQLSKAVQTVPQGVNKDMQHSPVYEEDMDAWTDQVIRANFDDLVMGQLFNRVIEKRGTIEAAMVFASIIAKAKITRLRRGRT